MPWFAVLLVIIAALIGVYLGKLPQWVIVVLTIGALVFALLMAKGTIG